jgi:hypothetical protein
MAVVRGMRWRGALVALLLAACLLALSAAAHSGVARADDPTASAGAASTTVVVRMGDRGVAVRRIQRRLSLSADGVFGPQTKRAVRRFQRRKRLEVDGIVGPRTRRALRLAPFSRDSVRSPRRRSGGGGGGAVDVPAILERIAECESGGDPTAVSSGGQYRGKYQFLRSTWESYGGTGDPAKASEAQQDRIALRLYRAQGTDPWPTCGRKARS